MLNIKATRSYALPITRDRHIIAVYNGAQGHLGSTVTVGTVTVTPDAGVTDTGSPGWFVGEPVRIVLIQRAMIWCNTGATPDEIQKGSHPFFVNLIAFVVNSIFVVNLVAFNVNDIESPETRRAAENLLRRNIKRELRIDLRLPTITGVNLAVVTDRCSPGDIRVRRVNEACRLRFVHVSRSDYSSSFLMGSAVNTGLLRYLDSD